LLTPDRALAIVTIGVVTKNRPDSLRECLASLALLDDSLAEIIVVDDTSDVPIADTLEHLPSGVARKLRLIRQRHHEGYIVARNTIVREASTDYVLLMDDDAWLLDSRSVLDAVALLRVHPQVGAVAFAMAGLDGSPWHSTMQPAPVDYTCYVPSFIGFAHLLRRDVFLRLGGYRESFHFYGEEKDYCLRLLDAGLDVVYTPLARVVHAADITGRSYSKYIRHTIRNDCLGALYNEPFPLPIVSVPLRLRRYIQMRGSHPDPGGLLWIVKDLLKKLPSVLRDRRPVRWATLRRWRRLRREWPAYEPAAA
jgi:GT2 family glycosyltransferase